MTKYKPKIAVIGLKGLPAYGGAATVGENIIEQLKDEYEFTVYSTSSHTQLKTGSYNGYQQIVLKSVRHQGFNLLLYYFKSAFHCLFTAKYDVVHIHHLAGAFIVPLLRLKYSNIFVTSHGMPDKIDKWKYISHLYYPLMRFLFARYSKIITTVSDLDSVYYHPYTKKRIIYIPNGIDDIPIKQPSLSKKPDITFAAGRIIAIKGCHVLLEALILNQFKGEINIAGDINQLIGYKKKILKLSEQLNVKFLGLIKDKSLLLGYIQQSRLFVFPSSVEAMSMMLLEVALTKTPIIASDIPENMAVFTSDEVLYFKVDDVTDLAEKIKYAQNNTAIMHNKAQLAYEKLFKQYNMRQIAQKYGDLYKEQVT